MFVVIRSISQCVLVLAVVLAFGAVAAAQVDPPASNTQLATPSRADAAQTADAGSQEPHASDGREKKAGEKRDIHEARLTPHPSFRFGEGTEIELRVRSTWDQRNAASDIDATEASQPSRDVVRRRIGVEGRLAGRFDFQVEREIMATDPWRDVFVNYSEFRSVQVQTGKFKLPLGLDENTSATHLDFVERSLAANQLAPGRDRGVMVHGRVLDRIVQYELGVFDHDGRNARTRNTERVFGGTTTAGRITAQPFRASHSSASDLQVGVAFTRTELPLGLASLRGESALGTVFYTPEQYVQGQRRRVALEGRWRPGPFSVKGEYIRVTTERIGQSVEDTDLPPLLATGWYVSGTWAITGERKSRGLDNPRRPLLRGGMGALEVAFRLETLTFGSAAEGEEPSAGPRAAVVLGNADRATTLGMNWYLNRWVKIQWNAIHEQFADRARISAPSSWSRVVRLQFTL